MNELIACRDCVSTDCTGCNMLVLYHALERNRFEALMNENRHLSIETDVAPIRYGSWLADREDVEWGNYLIRYRCSECKKRPPFDKEEYKFILSPYCPNCGAKMVMKGVG